MFELANVVAGIEWQPTIRGLLTVAMALVLLCGSIYLLLLTNVGTRLGLLVSSAGLFGWLTILCATWWIYAPGIGPGGKTASWKVVEANVGDLSQAALEKARPLDTSGLPDPDSLAELTPDQFEAVAADHEPELAGWRLLAPSDPARNEAQAAVDAYLTEGDGASVTGFEEPTDYVSLYALERGGKPDRAQDDLWGRISHKVTSALRLTHPTRNAIIQVQGTIEQEAEPGQPPPVPAADADEPVVSVMLVRDLGERRLPQAVATIGFGLLFALMCVMLHRRDQRAQQLRALVPAGGG